MHKRLEKIVTFSLLLLVMGSISTLFLGTSIREEGIEVVNQSDASLSAAQLCIYLGCAVFVVLRYKRMLVSLRAAWPFVLICLLAIASTAWSVDPSSTIRRSCVLLGTTFFAIYLGGRYSIEEFQNLLIRGLYLLIGISLVFLIVRPSVVLDPNHIGEFRGLTEHKNHFGTFMAVLLILGFTYQFKSRWRYARAATIVIAIAFLLWAHSGTSLISVICTCLFLPLLYLFRSKKPYFVPLTIIALLFWIAGFVGASQSMDAILNLMGKDPTLTGRTDIWRLVWEAIQKRPLLGYGFGAFWQGMQGPSAAICAYLGWIVPHSHNGYLEALLDLGAVGMGLIVIALLRTCRAALAYVRLQPGNVGFWPIAYMFYFLVHATGEATLIRRDHLTYFLFVALSTSLMLERRDEKAARRYAARQLEGGFASHPLPVPALAPEYGD